MDFWGYAICLEAAKEVWCGGGHECECDCSSYNNVFGDEFGLGVSSAEYIFFLEIVYMLFVMILACKIES